MKPQYIIPHILFLFFITTWAWAQCPTGTIHLSTQAEVDAFRTNYPSCTALPGNLTISGNNITDLSPLENLETIGEYLVIRENSSLENLDGLSSLSSIGGDLWISDNNSLANIDGLSSLSSIGGYLRIAGHSSLTDVNGLSSLSSIGGSVIVYLNSSLADVDGLSSLSSIGGDLDIDFNSSLKDVDGLSSLSSINGDLWIVGNISLENVDGLSSLSSIGGDLSISVNDSQANVDGLSSLSSIGGYLEISANSSLADVDGLSSLSSIGGILWIAGNSSLADVDGLSSLSSIGEYLYIRENSSLANIDGLSSLSSIGGYLYVVNNGSLANLDGLSSLSSIGGYLFIAYNSSLANVDGLSSLSSIDGFLEIWNNAILPSLEGLENIDPGSITDLRIRNNPLLSYCDLPNICTYLEGTGPRTISSNSGECDTEMDVKVACQENCPEDVTLSSQSQVEEYGNEHGSCTEISGNLIISGNNITDLSPLENLETIGGYLRIETNAHLGNVDGLSSLSSIDGYLYVAYNSSLTDVDGLSSLSSIGGYLYVGNNSSLANMDGLSSLSSIDGFLWISGNGILANVDGLSSLSSIDRFLYIGNNSSLANLDGLSSLSSIDGDLYIFNNAILPSLEGLENIDPGSITDLRIQNNSLLSYCDLPNICTYLEGTGPRTISSNSGECDTEMDVVYACLPEVVSVTNPADITVSCPVLYEDLDLPDTVMVTYDDGSTGGVAVNWDGTGFDSSTGAHILTGELELMNMATNPNHLTAQIGIIVEDITAPVLSCPESYEVDCDRVVTFDLPQATDECSAVSVMQTDGTGLSSGSVFPAGTTTLTFRAVDESGNASYCSLDVKVLPPLEIQAVSDVARGDTIHLTNCLPPDISRDDLDIGPHRGRISFRTNIYPADLPEPRPYGMWKLLEYAYEVTDRCGVTKSFENYVALYDLGPPVFLHFPADTTIDSVADLPPIPETVEILDICRYVVWDTVSTTPIVDPGTGDTLAFVRRWMAEDEVGNKSFRDQMIYIHSVPRPDLNSIKAHIVKESALTAARFPGGAGTDSIPVTLHRIDSVDITHPVDASLSGNWQGSKGNVFFTPLLPGSYRIKIDVPTGYEAVHPDSLVMTDGWSDTLFLSGDSILDLGTILLVPARDTTTLVRSRVQPGIPGYSELNTTHIKPFSIYPNPTTGQLKIDLWKGASLNYTIFNHLGRDIQHGKAENGSILDLSKQVNGMYFIRLENKEFVATKRILLFNP